MWNQTNTPMELWASYSNFLTLCPLLTPTADNAHVKSLLYTLIGLQNAHISQNNRLSCEILDIIHNLESHDNASLWWFKMNTVSFTSAELTTASRGTFSWKFWKSFFPDAEEEASICYCYHIVYITSMPYTYHYITACEGHAYLLSKTVWKEN